MIGTHPSPGGVCIYVDGVGLAEKLGGWVKGFCIFLIIIIINVVNYF